VRQIERTFAGICPYEDNGQNKSRFQHTAVKMSGSQDVRFLARSETPVRPLAQLALMALAGMIDQVKLPEAFCRDCHSTSHKVSRIKTTAVRLWAQKELPSFIRESLIVLSYSLADNGGSPTERAKSRITKFW
jgi:hypothetical protein